MTNAFSKELEDYLLNEAHSHEVTAVVSIYRLKPYPREDERTFRLRVVRALVWVGMDEGVTANSTGQVIRGYMSVQ